MFAFQLWREYKLSIAEIYAVFPKWKTIYFNKEILIIDYKSREDILEKADFLGWTIKIIEIIENQNNLDISKLILENAKINEWKYKYWINIFWVNPNLKRILNYTKNLLKNNSISSRFVNKDFTNLLSSQIIWEKLIKKETDFNLIIVENNEYIWKSIWVQDINNYSKRDWQKDRDMQVWMLPPKLAQMMINLSEWSKIYDPFIWLWTVLIESVLMWNKNIYWSDLSSKMVDISKNNILSLKYELDNLEIFKQNAKYIEEVEILWQNKIDAIVTEWYLWEIMTQKNISIERIEKQKENLLKLYEWFFLWLKKLDFKWNIVISFPFWEINTKFIYFNEIYELLEKYCNTQKFFPSELELKETKVWSLLYKRDKQLVGREIFKLKILHYNKKSII